MIFSNLPIPSSRTRPWVHSTCNKIEYQKPKKYVLGVKRRLARKAENLTAICEPIV
jgi:hypothetical protein